MSAENKEGLDIKLSPTQLEYLALAGSGETYPSIAFYKGVSETAAAKALGRVRRALNVRTNTQAALYGYYSGQLPRELLFAHLEEKVNTVQLPPQLDIGIEAIIRGDSFRVGAPVFDVAYKLRQLLGVRTNTQAVIKAVEQNLIDRDTVLNLLVEIPYGRKIVTWAELSDKERDFIQLTALGYPYKNIGTRYNITKFAVSKMGENIRGKLGGIGSNHELVLSQIILRNIDPRTLTEDDDVPSLEDTTRREKSLLEVLVKDQGKFNSDEAIAHEVGIASNTVGIQLFEMYQRFGFVDRTHLSVGYIAALLHRYFEPTAVTKPYYESWKDSITV